VTQPVKDTIVLDVLTFANAMEWLDAPLPRLTLSADGKTMTSSEMEMTAGGSLSHEPKVWRLMGREPGDMCPQ